MAARQLIRITAKEEDEIIGLLKHALESQELVIKNELVRKALEILERDEVKLDE